VGQFVTFWKRNKQGVTTPFSDTYFFNFFVIKVKDNAIIGQFVFPKWALIKCSIISKEEKEDKRAFRIYPIWDAAISKQYKLKIGCLISFMN
jgi:hypothetical protein